MEVPQIAIKREVDNFTSERNESYETNNSDLVKVILAPIKIEPGYEIVPNTLNQKLKLLSDETKMFDCSLNKIPCEQTGTEVKLEGIEAMEGIQNMEDLVDEKWTVENNELNIKDEKFKIRLNEMLSDQNCLEIKREKVGGIEGYVNGRQTIENDELNIKDEEEINRCSSKETTDSSKNKRNDSLSCDQCAYKTTQERLLKLHLERHKKPETTKLKYIKSTYSRIDIFEIWLKSGKTTTEKNQKTREVLLDSFTEEHLCFYRKFIIHRISIFCSHVTKRWEAANRCKARFLKKNGNWLKREISLLPANDDFAKMQQKQQDSENTPVKYTTGEALLLLVVSKLTKAQYTTIRLQSKMRNADIYPPYNSLRSAKKYCYPDPNSITIISPNEAEVKLQSLLDHTVSRILLAQKKVLNQIDLDIVSREMNLVLKWGCCGRTGHTQLKQVSTDNDMFITSFVPLHLNFNYLDGSKYTLWQNSCSSSLRYCRPVKIQFKNESAELSQEEFNRVQRQINSLVPYEVVIKDTSFLIKYTMILNMIDEKSGNSTSDQTSLDILNHGRFPLEQLFEEAQECLDLLKRSRTGRTSKENYIEDLIKCLLVSSDPYITSLRKLPQKRKGSLNKDVLHLFGAPDES